MILAGDPISTDPGGQLRVTTEFAPIIELSPIVILPNTMLPV